MEVFEAIQKRHSVRSYLPDKIPSEKMAKILEAGRLAPSAGNIQPWHFIIFTDQQKRKKLSKGRYAKFLVESPIVLVGCGDKKASPNWYAVDTTIAMQNMVLTATSEGLATCWIGSFNERQVKKLLNIPERFRVIVEKHTFVHENEKIKITVSIGISFAAKEKYFSQEELVQLADEALYKSKKNGRNRVEFKRKV